MSDSTETPVVEASTKTDFGAILDSLDSAHAPIVSTIEGAKKGDTVEVSTPPVCAIPADSFVAVFAYDTESKSASIVGFVTLDETAVADGLPFAALPDWRVFRATGELLSGIGKAAKIDASDLADIEAAAKLQARLDAVNERLAAKRAKRAGIAADLAEADADIAAATVAAFVATDASDAVSGSSEA